MNEARYEANHAQELERPMPHADVKLTEEFLSDHQDLFAGLAASRGAGRFSTAGAVDGDVRAAIEALIKTYRTLESGLVYETKGRRSRCRYPARQTGTGPCLNWATLG